ncbi:porin [Paraburkholderia caledonica]|uniref:porin n=1 Tax=Paraburkholderia caledonica TaxID=134536 RepID=UPI000362F878|nr:porin [Paraburkholderia caledonica]
MKRTNTIVLAVAGLAASAAHAQSSVTLYGVLDEGISYTSNVGGHSVWSISSGNINGSRWGLRGSEELGSGFKAIFTLENGYNISNGTLGQNGRLFGRQAFVGLSSSQYGSVTMGRQYDGVVDYLAPLSLTGTASGGTFFAHPYDNDNLDNAIRLNNTIKYSSVNYGGFKFGGMYGFSNSTEFANNRAYSFGASYVFGGLTVATGYLQLNNDVNNFAVAVTSPGTATGTYGFKAGTQRTFGSGINYSFGSAILGFVYSQTNLSNAAGGGVSAGQSGTHAGISFAGDSARFQNFEGNIRYFVTPSVLLSGAYTYTRSNLGGGLAPNYNQVSLLADYLLSKRTDLYLIGQYQHVSSNPEVHAYLNTLSATSSTQTQINVSAGIRHRF